MHRHRLGFIHAFPRIRQVGGADRIDVTVAERHIGLIGPVTHDGYPIRTIAGIVGDADPRLEGADLGDRGPQTHEGPQVEAAFHQRV